MTVSVIGHDQQTVWARGDADLSVVLNIPGGVTSGCLLVIYGTGATAIPPPTGWTGLGTNFSGKYFGAWRVADGTEGSTVTVDFGTRFGTQYEAESPVLIAFSARTYTESPSTSWQQLSPHSITGGFEFDATDTSTAASDVIYLAWVFQTDNMDGAGVGFDVCTAETITWDSALTELTSGCSYSEHVTADDDSRGASMSSKWAVASLPVTGSDNPATASTITGTSFTGNRYIHRTLQAGNSGPSTYTITYNIDADIENPATPDPTVMPSQNLYNIAIYERIDWNSSIPV